MSLRANVVIAGGGISGLAAAHSAQAAGASVLVLEAAGQSGGVMQTEHNGGFLVEHGPTSMAATADALKLLRELGIADDIVEPPKTAARRYVVRNGAMHALPSSPPSLIKSELLTASGKFRLLGEFLVPAAASDAPEESLADIVRRRFGSEVLDYVVDPFVSGVCAGDPEKLSSRHVLRVIAELERESGSVLKGAIKRARASKGKREGHIVSFKRGMSQLSTALAQSVQGSYLSNAKLVSVRDVATHVELLCEINGTRETVYADAFVCALPSHVLATINWPAQWRAEMQRMELVPYAPIATVAFGFKREDVAHALDGFGVLIPSSEHRQILGALFNSSMFAGRAPDGHVLITAFVGGSRFFARNGQSVASDFSPEACTRLAIAELTLLLGLRGQPVLTSVASWRHGIPQLEVGHHQVLTAASAIENQASRAFFTGSYLSGAAIGDCLAHGSSVGQRAAAHRVRQVPPERNILARTSSAGL